jgi:hypothetical protein
VAGSIHLRASEWIPKRLARGYRRACQKDQLLAEIDTPDLDQQLAQAKSQAVLAKRNLEQAKKTNTKWQELYKEGVVSQLDAENTDTSQGTNKATPKRLPPIFVSSNRKSPSNV